MRVRVIDPATTTADTLLLLLANAALLTLGVAAVLVSRRLPSREEVAASPSLLIAALLAVVVGAVTMGPLRLAAPAGSLRAVLPLVGTGLIALAWVLAGAGLRARGTRRRRAALAFVLYLVIGLLWVTDYNAALGMPVTRVLADPSFVLAAVAWPLQVAQLLGLFGLTIG